MTAVYAVKEPEGYDGVLKSHLLRIAPHQHLLSKLSTEHKSRKSNAVRS